MSTRRALQAFPPSSEGTPASSPEKDATPGQMDVIAQMAKPPGEVPASLYRSLIEQIPAVIYLEEEDRGDPELLRTLYMSPQIEGLVGHRPDVWTFDYWLTKLHPEDRERVRAADQHASATGNSFSLEYRVIRPNGQQVWVHDQAVAIREEPELPRLWLGMIQDITPRRQAEQALQESDLRFRTLVEQIPAVTHMERWHDPRDASASEPVTYVSPQIEEIWGITPEERISDPAVWRSLIHPEDRELVLDAERESLRDGTPRVADYRLARPDGRIVWVHEDSRLIRSSSGEPMYWLSVTFDVTQAKVYAQKLERSVRELRHIDELRRVLLSKLVGAQEAERQRIAADIHDDSVQKMAAINLRLAVLRRRVSDPATSGSLEQIETTVQDTIHRLRQLMFELWPPELDRHGLVPAIRAKITDVETETGVRFELENHLRKEVPPDVRTIAYRILQETITNVRKHAEATNVLITLEPDAGGIRITVRDDGSGFDTPPESPNGHLGLSTMRERASLAGGWLRIVSARGRGTTVEFWLPGERAADNGRRDHGSRPIRVPISP